MAEPGKPSSQLCSGNTFALRNHRTGAMSGAPFPGYGWNLVGSLAGILAFTVLSFSSVPPAVWILLGVSFAVPFFFRERWLLAALALLVTVLALPQVGSFPQHTLWSPYYRITILEVPPPQGWPRPPAYLVDVSTRLPSKNP